MKPLLETFIRANHTSPAIEDLSFCFQSFAGADRHLQCLNMKQGRDRSVSAYKFFIFGSVFLFLFLALAFSLYTPLSFTSSVILALNCVAFYLCGYDKAAAKAGPANWKEEKAKRSKTTNSEASTGSLRVPEKVFYGLALFGAAPFLLLAMKLFRHKTKKTSFHFFLALIIISQIALLSYLNQLYGPLLVK